MSRGKKNTDKPEFLEMSADGGFGVALVCALRWRVVF
jgi:hypothetical protein